MIEQRPMGRTRMRVSVLGFGGSEIGYRDTPQEEVDILLNGALDAGVNVIDTAECYPGSEERIGRAVGHRRSDYFLFTKCGHAAAYSSGDPRDWDPATMAETIDRSLKRLRTDHVDLVQLHSCSKEVLERGDAIETLRKARSDGKTRFIGYSGDGDAALHAVWTDAFDVLQTSVNIADQQSIELLLHQALERRMGVIAKRPIANAAWRSESEPTDAYIVEYWRRLRKLDYGFLKGDPAEAIGTALRFTLSQPAVHTAIVGTTKLNHLESNQRMAAMGPLPPAQVADIRARWVSVSQGAWEGRT